MLPRMAYPIAPGCEPWSAQGTGARANTALVLSHGFTGNPLSMVPLGKALAERGFTVEVVRLPGHGTHWRDMATTRYADWRGEVERAVDAHIAAGQKTVLVGLSLGGTMTLDLAATKKLAGMVAINAAILDRPGLLPKVVPYLMKVIPAVPFKASGLVENDIAKGGNEKTYPWVPLKAAQSIQDVLPAIRANLPKITCPAIIAYSPQDHSVPPENSKAALKMLTGTKPIELVLERSYHVATLDYDFDLLVEKIEA